MFTQNEERLLRFKTYTFLVLLGGVALSIACFSYLWLFVMSGPWVRPAVLLALLVTFGFFSAAIYTFEGIVKLRQHRDNQKRADAPKDDSGRHRD